MTDDYDRSAFLKWLRVKLREDAAGKTVDDQRHPARESQEYRRVKSEVAEQIDALYAQIVQDIRDDLAEIDDTVGPIAEPMAEELAKGAVSDVFEAAAEVLKAQIRRDSGHSS